MPHARTSCNFTTTMITVSDLPIELHFAIVQCLHHYRDRRTLLSAALVCKDWQTLSQRVLFSIVTDYWYESEYRMSSVRSTHMLFLRTIVEHPHRLGPLVRSYAQEELAYNPAATRAPWLAESCYQLWTLTEKALPAMANLKHLYLNPLADSLPSRDDWVSSRMLLNSFTFQLETLTWRNYFHPRNGIPEFLLTQKNLTHLENGRYASSRKPLWLEDDVCPHLISLTGGFNSLIHVSRSRKIVAWKWDPTNKEETIFEGSSVLDSLKYLSVYTYEEFRSTFGHIDVNVDLLELNAGALKLSNIASLANLPSLRVLVFISSRYFVITKEEIVRCAGDCFKQLPSLESIILRYSNFDGSAYRYAKFWLSPGSTEDILQKELSIHYDVGVPWWSIYNA